MPEVTAAFRLVPIEPLNEKHVLSRNGFNPALGSGDLTSLRKREHGMFDASDIEIIVRPVELRKPKAILVLDHRLWARASHRSAAQQQPAHLLGFLARQRSIGLQQRQGGGL